MAVRTGSNTYVPGKGYQKPERSQKTPTVVTVKPSGKVTATGPGAKQAAQKEREQRPKTQAKIKRIEGALANEAAAKAKAEYAVKHAFNGGPSASDVLNAVKNIATGNNIVTKQQTNNPVSGAIKSSIKEDAGALAKAAKEHLTTSPHNVGGLFKPAPLKAQQAGVDVASFIPAAEGASAAEKALSKAANAESYGRSPTEALAKAAEAAKKAPKAAVKAKVQRIRETPTRIRTAPARAVKTIKRAPELKTKEGQVAAAKATGKTVLKHPIKTGVPAAAVVPIPGDPGHINERAKAFLEGTAAATVNHPGKVLETTAHGALGAFAVPWDIGKAAVNSVQQGSTKPLTETASALGKGAVHMAKNLASGNPKKVEETTLQETGLTPFIPLGAAGKLARDSHLYQDVLRGGLRDYVESKRALTRETRKAAEAKAKEAGVPVIKKGALRLRKRAAHEKPVRLAVEDTTRKGEHYVLRRTGERIERQRGRHYIAREVDRIAKKGELHGKYAAKPIVKELRKSKLTNHKAVNASDALAIAADYGLSRDRATGLQQLKEIQGNFEAPKATDPTGVVLARHSVQWMIDHPEVFEDKHFWNAVDMFKKQSEEVGLSGRKRFLASAVNAVNPRRLREGRERILLPEERIPKSAEKFLPKRAAPWSRTEAMDFAKKREQELHDLRREGNFAAAKKLEREQKGLVQSFKGLMKPPKHGGAEGGISTTRAVAYTPEMLHGFLKDMEAAHKEYGYETPAAYVAHKVPSSLEPEDIASGTRGNVPLRKIWPSQGKAVRSGNTETSLESLLQHSVLSPRTRKAMSQGLDRIFTSATRKVEGKRLLTRTEVEQAINSHKVPPGTIFVRPQMLKRALEEAHGKSPAEVIEHEIEQGQEIGSAGGKELHNALVEAEQKGLKGEKFAPMDSAQIHALMGHMERIGTGLGGIAHATNGASRVILNSPAFLAIRFTHEIPAALALGKAVVDVPAALANLKRIANFPPEVRAELSSIWGTSPGLLGDPAVRELRATALHDPIRAAARPPVWRKFWNLVNGNVGGAFDRARTAKAREVIGTAKFIHDLHAARKGFNAWRSSAHNIFKDMEHVIEKTRNMSDSEALAYVAQHPTMGDKLMQDMTSNAGNFTSLTVFEKHIAPLTLFYSFQRYTVMWTLFHFPLDHPIVSTALNWLGQANYQELKKSMAKYGEEPSLLQAGYGIVENGPGKEAEVLPGALRANPLLAGVQRAAAEKKPSQLLGELSPEFQIPITAIMGESSFTGEKIKGNRLVNMLQEIAALAPGARLAGLSALGKEVSGLAKAYRHADPLREQRSVLDPFIGQTVAQLAEENKLGGKRGIEGKYGKYHIPGPFDSQVVQELLYGGPGETPQPKLLPKVLEGIHESEEASNFIKKKEEPYYGKSKPFSAEQKKLLEEVENAYKTGPNAKKPTKVKRTGIGGGGSSIGGYSVGGGSVGGGSIGGGGTSIGGHPVGSIGG